MSEDERWRRRQREARRLRDTPFKRAARELKLKVETPDDAGSPVETMEGRLGDVRVSVRREPASAEGAFHWQVTASCAAIPAGLSLGREGGLSGLARAVGINDIQTGDAAFDGAIRISGDRNQALAVLTEAVRALVLELVPLGVRVASGAVTVEAVDDRNLEVWKRRIRQAATLAGWLSLGDEDAARHLRKAGVRQAAALGAWLGVDDRDVVLRLLQNARADGQTSVRLANLQAAIEADPREVARQAAELLTDTAPAVRALAALHAGDIGVRILDEAIHHPEVPRKLVDQALERLADRSVLPGLSEPTLLAMLDRRIGDKVAVFGVLGRVGTHDALPAILEAGRGLFVPAAVRAAADQAVSAIQLRHGGAPTGGLSVSAAEDAEGGLSLGDGGGELSSE